VVAHLGQSLDGRIAAANGASRWVTGDQDIVHNHRMRALFDAVVVGAGTVAHDDPQLTVRAVPGPHPVRVVLDTQRRLGAEYRVFNDGEAPTLLLCAADLAQPGERQGQAEVLGVATSDQSLCLRAVLDCLAERRLARVFVEGGGVTVSRFLAAGCLHRLQITIAPLILGSGRPSITLPEIEQLSAGLRPVVRRHDLGADVLFDCRLDG
jgi:riboflavin-specific deaminase-like protein